MAAIPTLHTFNGTGFSGFTNPGSTLTESGGSAVPSSPASDASLYYNTANTEVSNSSSLTGTVAKIVLSGGLEDGSKVRVWLGTDENNNVYAELEKGGVTLFSDVKDDIIRLGRRTAGVDAGITDDTPVQYLQEERGHLRHYLMLAGNSFSLAKVLNQYIVKFSPTDPIDGRDTTVADTIILSETDGSAVPATTKMGFTLKGSVHTNGIALFQGGSFSAKVTATTGSDSNNGTYTSPYQTIKKLMENVQANQIGFMRGGNYGGGVGEGVGAPFNSTFYNGTSWEDAPLFMPFGEESVQQDYSGGVAHYYVKGFLQYRYLYNWVMDANDSALNCMKIWASNPAGTGTTPRRMRLHRMTMQRVGGHSGVTNPGAAIEMGIGIGTGSATDDDLNKYHHVLDCSFSDNDYVSETKTGGTGFYCQGSYYLMEYCQTHRNFGAGYKIFDAGGTGGLPAYTTCNYNVIRFHRSDGNRSYGGEHVSGTDNITHSGIYSNCFAPNGTGSGIMIGYGAINALVYNNICYGNIDAGISFEVQFGPSDITGAKVINNTCYNNRWNFQLVGSTHEVVTPLFKNNTAHSATTANYRNTATSTPTFESNHEDSPTGFGSVFGDPLFEDAPSNNFTPQAGSPLLGSGTNASAYFTRDFERKPLPQDSWHIGAIARATAAGQFEFYDQNSNESPLTTKWTTISGKGNCKGVFGVLSPVTPTTESGAVSTSSWTVLDNATATQALVYRVQLPSTLTAGVPFRIIYSYLDANNYYYVLCEPAKLGHSTAYRDVMTLWRRVGGTEAQINPSATLKEYQLQVGDLRKQRLASSTIRVSHYADQHLIELNDIPFLHETDANLAAGGKVAFLFAAGSHVNSLSNIQVEVIPTVWCASTGNDSNTGARTAPKLTKTAMITAMTPKKIGVFRTNTFNGSTIFSSFSPQPGTLRQGGPQFINYKGETVNWNGTAVGHEPIYLNSTTLKFWKFHGFNCNNGGFHIHTLLGATDLVISEMTFTGSDKSAVLLSGESGDSYYGGHLLMDCHWRRCGLGSRFDHDIYISSTDVDIWYPDIDGESLAQGYAVHGYNGSSTTGSSRLFVGYGRVRNHIEDNTAGILLGRGEDCRAVGMHVWNCSRGVELAHNAVRPILEWSIVRDSVFEGVRLGAFNCTDGLVANVVSVDNGLVGIYGESLNVNGRVKNCISLDNVGGQISGTAITQTTNITSGTQASLFVDPANNDFRMKDGAASFEAGTDLTADGVELLDRGLQSIPQFVGWPIGAYDFANDAGNLLKLTVSDSFSLRLGEVSEAIGPPNETILLINTGIQDRYSLKRPVTIYWKHDPTRDYLQQAVPFVTIKVSYDGGGTYPEEYTGIPNVVGWNSYSFFFTQVTAQGRILIVDEARSYVLTQGPANFEVAEVVQVRGSL